VRRVFFLRSLWLVGAIFVLALTAGPAWAVTPDDVVVSADPVNWTPHVLDGTVSAIEQVGNTIVVAGDFTQVKQPGGAVLDRHNIFSFDALTGTIDTGFAPNFDRPIDALVAGPDGLSVYVAGRFNTVDGFARKGLIKLELGTGARIAAFHARPNLSVFDMTLAGNQLIIGGNFSKVNGLPRSVLAAVDPTTGDVQSSIDLTFSEPRSTSSTQGSLSVQHLSAAPDGSRLVVTGNFSRIQGLARHQVAVVDLTTTPASLANWATDRYLPACPSLKWPAYLRDVDVSPDGTWFSIVTTGAYGGTSRLCDTTTRWELGASGTNLQPTWVDQTGGDTLMGVAVTRSAVYVGGHQRWMNNPFAADRAGPGAVPRSGIAALDTRNGLPLSWNPGRQPRGIGASALVPTSAGLWVGSDTNYLAGEYHARLAFLPANGGTPLPADRAGTTPGDLYRAGPTTLTRQTFDGTTAGPAVVADSSVVNWSAVRGALMLDRNLYTGWSDGRLYVRSYDGTSFGSPVTIDLHGLTSTQFPLAIVTGMFFDPASGRLYYTVDGDKRMFFRYFTPESNVVGSEWFVVSGETDGFDWKRVAGMTLASGRIYFAQEDGSLWAVGYSDGKPVPGTAVRLDGPGPGGRDWSSNGLFMFPSAP
jgi:hypothetical protein